jgi:hypothetical protein
MSETLETSESRETMGGAACRGREPVGWPSWLYSWPSDAFKVS